jgi:hypothetical protein
VGATTVLSMSIERKAPLAAEIDGNGDIITTGDAAKILKLSADRVRQLEGAGILTARRTATGVRLFDRSTVLRLSRERSAALVLRRTFRASCPRVRAGVAGHRSNAAGRARARGAKGHGEPGEGEEGAGAAGRAREDLSGAQPELPSLR